MRNSRAQRKINLEDILDGLNLVAEILKVGLKISILSGSVISSVGFFLIIFSINVSNYNFKPLLTLWILQKSNKHDIHV